LFEDGKKTDTDRKKVFVITGPTATGKSALGVLLAEILNGEIVSADSMQVYRGMDIGTAKVTKEEMNGIPHHMIDVADPDEPYSVARYVEEATVVCEDLIRQNKLPVIVGGTGLYIDSLIAGRTFESRSDEENRLREELNLRYEQQGGQNLLEELRTIDPTRAEKLFPNDKKRIVRALEIYYLTGKTITEHDLETQKIPPKYDAVTVALDFKNREDLYKRINDRVDKMVESGLFKEVEGLVNKGLNTENTSMQAIGYKEVLEYFQGTATCQEAIEKIKQESRRYAKRQLTWLRRDSQINWICWDKDPDLFAGLKECLSAAEAGGITEL